MNEDDADAAWKRLLAHFRTREPGDVLESLDDIGTVRRMLDRAELAFVRSARQQGRSWAEIATGLGITRQSAWERWRDLDGDPSASSSGAEDEPNPAIAAVERAVREVSLRVRRHPETPRVTALVPDVVTMTVQDARDVLDRAGFIGVGHNPGGSPLPGDQLEGVVVDQVPKAGARRRRGSRVTLWVLRNGGSAGVREPRTPQPSPRAGRVEQDLSA